MSDIKDKKRFRGWLALFIYGMPLYILNYFSFLTQHPDISANWEQLGRIPAYRFALVWMMAGYAVRVLGPIGGLIFSYARSSTARTYWQYYFIFIAIYSVCEILAFKLGVNAAILANPVKTDALESLFQGMTHENMTSVAVSFTWLMYWRKSKQAQETFVEQR